jgi:hypothetical protein
MDDGHAQTVAEIQAQVDREWARLQERCSLSKEAVRMEAPAAADQAG